MVLGPDLGCYLLPIYLESKIGNPPYIKVGKFGGLILIEYLNIESVISMGTSPRSMLKVEVRSQPRPLGLGGSIYLVQ